MSFNFERFRRLRNNQAIRNLVRETHLHKHDLIYPLFVVEGENIKEEVPSMPNVYHFSLDRLEEEIKEIVDLEIQAVIIFGVPKEKDELGTEAYNEEGIVQRAIRKIKKLAPNLLVIADTCLCEFTSHGHCGIIKEEKILNDPSLDYLARTAVSQARAGADIIAPSNMMDGFVEAIRYALDDTGFSDIPIMSYAVKYASSFYGPFRDAAHSAPQFGDRKSYQMDPANIREALREALSDVRQGADIIMVKPALAYLDVVRAVREQVNLPIAAYNVSGEYVMVKAAAQKGWINERQIVMEMLTSMKRAGADMILTYFAKDVAKYLRDGE